MLRPIAASLLFAAAVAAQQPPSPIAPTEHKQRRVALAAAIGADYPDQQVLVVLRGGGKQPDMGAFAQDQDFLYLTGVAEPARGCPAQGPEPRA